MYLTKSIDLDGKKFTVEAGKFAKQASGAVMVSLEHTMVLSTVVSSDEPVEGQDFFPLSVEYREKTSAAGKIPGGYIKREGRPSEKEILSARLIDRPIRPMFPKDYLYETQIVTTVYSADQANDSDTIGAIGASLALTISDIPFDGPIAEVKIGKIDGKFILNPTHQEIEKSSIEITVAGTEDSIVMVEGEAKEISEEEMLAALKFAHEWIVKIVKFQKEFALEYAKQKRDYVKIIPDENLINDVTSLLETRINEIVHTVLLKDDRKLKMKECFDQAIAEFGEKYPEKEKDIKQIIHDIEKKCMREMILNEGKRLDGRELHQIRPITCEVGLLPRTHGSGLFTRGETQSLCSLTLGTKMDEQLIDGLLPEYSKRYMLHYNFPPFSTGEVGRMTGVSRREIGHGNLAERSLKFVLPSEKDFPYTIRLVSDILESNGSSSMASVCAGCLSLLDGGVPISKSVAGIAMGLIKEDDRIAVLTDILGNEDHLGDMDFKVAGTKEGITAFQMDIKIKGISFEIMETALKDAKAGRLKILEIMEEAIKEPRPDLSSYAPRLTKINIQVDQIGMVIGPGGKTIRNIVAESGAEINIDDDGTVIIAAVTKESSDKAREMINRIVELPEEGKIYKGKVKRIVDFGAFVEIIPGKEGLLHISQIDHVRVRAVEDVLKVGDEIEVKLLKIEGENKLSLSRKALIENTSKSQTDDNQQSGDRPHSHDKQHSRNPHHDNRSRH